MNEQRDDYLDDAGRGGSAIGIALLWTLTVIAVAICWYLTLTAGGL